MAKITASTSIERPAEEVWKLAIDWSKGPQWDPGLVECRVTSEGPLGVGTTLRSKRTTRGLHLAEFRVTEYEPERRLTAEFTSPKMLRGSSETLTFQSAEGRTKVNLAWNLKLNGFYSLLGPFLAPSIKKGAETDLVNLKRILESGSKS